MIWYSNLFQNFPQFIVIHTDKGFGLVNKTEINVFLGLSSFFHDPVDVGNFISGSSAFFKTSLNIWKIHGSHIAEAWLGVCVYVCMCVCVCVYTHIQWNIGHKKNEIMPFAVILMELEIVILHEVKPDRKGQISHWLYVNLRK